MMSNSERLVYMANQIAQNLAGLGDDHAVAETAKHLAAYWDPRMKAQIFAMEAGASGLSDVAARAVDVLRGQA